MFATTAALARVPAFPAAFTAILFSILAQAMAGSYMTLNAVERAGMSPLQLSIFLTASAASSILVTALLGRRLDRRAERWPLLLSLAAAVAGYGLIAVVTDPLWLMGIALLLVGPSNAAFTLLFGIAKGFLDRTDTATASSGMAAMRMNSSLAWAVGPALGALAVLVLGFPGVYLGAAACGLLALAIAVAANLAPTTTAAASPAEPGAWRTALPAAAAMTLFHTAMFMGSNAMVIVVGRDLGGAETDVGLLFSLCAAIEVVVMGAFVVRPAKSAGRRLLGVGFAIFAAYFLAPLLIPTLATLYWAQILRAVAIGIISVLGMTYVQEQMPGRPGAASALFANAVNLSFLISGIGTGLWRRPLATGRFSASAPRSLSPAA